MESNKKDYILNKLILPVYQNFIYCEEFILDEFEISLPLFLNTGHAVDIIIDYTNNDKIVLKNKLHLLVEEALKEKINYLKLRKNYLKENAKIKHIEKKYIKDNGIIPSLLQEKTLIATNDLNELRKEIFCYIFSIVRYYNYVYDYIINNLKNDDRKKFFSLEIKRFVEQYNIKNNLNLIQIDKRLDENSYLASENNEYYIGEKKLLTGVNDKVHFLEAVRDIEVLKKNYKIESLIIVQKEKGKNGLNEKYMMKFINAEFEYIENNLELDFKETKKEIKDGL